MIISITRFELRSIFYLPVFMYHALNSKRQSERSEGLIELKLRNQSSLIHLTFSGWEDENCITDSMKKKPHLDALKSTYKLAKSAESYR